MNILRVATTQKSTTRQSAALQKMICVSVFRFSEYVELWRPVPRGPFWTLLSRGPKARTHLTFLLNWTGQRFRAMGARPNAKQELGKLCGPQPLNYVKWMAHDI